MTFDRVIGSMMNECQKEIEIDDTYLSISQKNGRGNPGHREHVPPFFHKFAYEVPFLGYLVT